MTTAARPDKSHASVDREDAGFQRRLGPFDVTMLVIGTMIGSGIFVTSADIARDVGSTGWLLAIWGLAGVMTILGALSYSELAAAMPHAGGQYVFLREAYSPMWGFLYGWTCFLVIQTGSIAAVAVVFAKYLGVLVPALGTDNEIFKIANVNLKLYLPFSVPFLNDEQGNQLPFFEMKHFTISAGQLVAVVVIAFLTWLNCRGVQEGKFVQNLMTVAKTLALVLLILIGLFVVGSAVVGALFSADAWNNITFTAGETRNPRRTLPLSLALGTGTVILLYLLANVAYVSALPVRPTPKVKEKLSKLQEQLELLEKQERKEEAKKVKAELDAIPASERGIARARDDRVGTAVLELWSPNFGAPLMAIAIMISTFGCVNGMTLMGARLYCVMARDKLFFQGVGHLNRRSVPAVGLVLQGAWSILLVFSGTYNELLDYVIFAVLVFYVLTVTGLFVLRRTQPYLERPVKAFGYPVLPALYVFLCAAIMLDLLIVKPKYTWPGLIIVLTGIPVYFL